MSTRNERQPVISNALRWRAILTCLMVFTATFLLFGMLWPAMSPGYQASLSVDFCLPADISTLSQSEIKSLENLIANQVSSQLSGSKFDTLVWQTKRTGPVRSSTIEYSDHETIHQNTSLSFNFDDNGGQVQIHYTCQGTPDQLRFLQMVGQQAAKSIDGFFISKHDGIVSGEQLNADNIDRAIWIANQIQTDLSQVQDTRIASHQQVVQTSNTPYSLASSKKFSHQQLSSQQTAAKPEISAIDATSLISILEEIRNQSLAPTDNDVTFSIVNVSPVKSKAINATPGRWAMLGIITMSCLVTGLVAMNQFATVNAPGNVESLSETLGIPVVAILPTESTSTDDEFISTVAESLITLSKYFLLFTCVVFRISRCTNKCSTSTHDRSLALHM